MSDHDLERLLKGKVFQYFPLTLDELGRLIEARRSHTGVLIAINQDPDRNFSCIFCTSDKADGTPAETNIYDLCRVSRLKGITLALKPNDAVASNLPLESRFIPRRLDYNAGGENDDAWGIWDLAHDEWVLKTRIFQGEEPRFKAGMKQDACDWIANRAAASDRLREIARKSMDAAPHTDADSSPPKP